MLQYRLDGGSDAAFAFTNAGGIRATIDAGPVTRGEVLAAFPFGNAVVELQYTGADLVRIFEGAVSGVNQFNGKELGGFFQVSRGVRVEYNPDNAPGARLVRLTVGGAPVEPARSYTVVTIDFLAGGGDNILEPVANPVVLDTMDEVLVAYVQAQSPIDFELEGRIAVVDGQATGGGGGGNATASATPPRSTDGGPAPVSGATKALGLGASVALLVFTAMLYVVVA